MEGTLVPVSVNYNYANPYSWGSAYAFRESLNSAYAATYGIIPQFEPRANNGFANPTISYATAPLKSVPDPAYASLFTANSAGPVGISANSWGPTSLTANLPPMLSPQPTMIEAADEPVGDLYDWSDLPTEEPTRRTRRQRRDRSETSGEAQKPRQTVEGKIVGDPVYYGADGEYYKILGKAGKIYNLFSDDGIQLNGKYSSFDMGAGKTGNAITELGFVNNGKETTVKLSETKLTVTSLGKTMEFDTAPNAKSENYEDENISWNANNKKLTFKAEGPDGEKWEFAVSRESYLPGNNAKRTNWLNIDFTGSNIVKGEYTTTGLWGHSFDGTKSDVDGKDDTGGGGVLRAPDGSILSKTVQGADYDKALAGYEMDSLTDTTGGWSTY
jgi:hypothetical protein